MKLFLKEMENGYLIVVDEHGEAIGWQESVNIEQAVDDLTRVTIVILLDPKHQMYKGDK